MLSRSANRRAGDPGLAVSPEEAITAFSRRRGEPEWLLQSRLDAWQSAVSASVPEPPGERWLTDLTSLRVRRLALTALASEGAPLAQSAPGETERVTSSRYGEVAYAADARFVARGLVVCDLAAAAVGMPDVVRPHLDALYSRHDSLSAALWTSGVLVYVPAGLQVDEPVLLSLGLPDSARGLFWRALVVAEEGSRIALREIGDETSGAAGSLATGLLEVVVEPAAQASYLAASRLRRATSGLLAVHARVERQGQFSWYDVGLGGDLRHVRTSTTLAGEGARMEIAAIFVAAARQRVEMRHEIRHRAAATKSRLAIAGLAGDSARAQVETDVSGDDETRAGEVDSRIEVLTLGSLARVDLSPRVEIASPELKVSQAAVVREPDEDAIGKGMAAGLTRAQATLELARGLLSPVVSRTSDPSAWSTVERAIDEALAWHEAGARPAWEG